MCSVAVKYLYSFLHIKWNVPREEKLINAYYELQALSK